MLIMEDISQLVAYYSCLANGSIYIGMGMTINPYINTAVGYQVAQLRSEGTIDERILMLRCHHLPSRQVMGNHNNLLCRTLCHAFPDEVQAELMQLIILIYLNEFSFVFSLTEIIHTFPHEILILCRNV